MVQVHYCTDEIGLHRAETGLIKHIFKNNEKWEDTTVDISTMKKGQECESLTKTKESRIFWIFHVEEVEQYKILKCKERLE